MTAHSSRWPAAALATALGMTAIAWAGACAGSSGEPADDDAPPVADRPAASSAGGDAALEARLPDEAGRFAPSHVRLVEGDPADVERLAEVQACADCHEQVVAQWKSSPHALASFNNPYYRSIVDAFREEAGHEASRFCAGCHEPLLLLSGKMDEAVSPGDPLAHAGVTCLVCHGIRDARPDGNASYTLTTAPVLYPDPADPEEIEAHRERLRSDALGTPRMCGSCHRSFLGPAMGNPHHLPGISDPVAWQRSAYADSHASVLDTPVEQKDCRGCHMPKTRAVRPEMAAADGTVASHRWPGGHRTLARLLGDGVQERAVARQLRGAATVDVGAARGANGEWTVPSDGAPVRAGEALVLDVVVRNAEVGHRFPGGTRDIQDTWVAVRVTDARGRVVGEAGTDHADGRRDDPSAFRLRSAPVDEQGRFEELHRVHRFRATVFDNTVAPRDASVVRYRLELPEQLGAEALPLRVEAQLLHRRHSRAMHRAACESTRSKRGRAFAAAAREMGRVVLDGCEEQPVTQVAKSVVWLGEGADDERPRGDARRPAWQRAFEHGLGLVGGLQERLDEARPSLTRALELLEGQPDRDRERAMAMAAAARLAGRQGRLEETESWLERAEQAIGPHPALSRIRGEVHARLWRWPEAAEAFANAVAGAPRDDSLWRALARARGSARNDRAALSAAHRGLLLAPRDGALLRSQALALRELGDSDADRAHGAFLDHRVPDLLPALRARCTRELPTCNRDRQPVPTLALETLGR